MNSTFYQANQRPYTNEISIRNNIQKIFCNTNSQLQQTQAQFNFKKYTEDLNNSKNPQEGRKLYSSCSPSRIVQQNQQNPARNIYFQKQFYDSSKVTAFYNNLQNQAEPKQEDDNSKQQQIIQLQNQCQKLQKEIKNLKQEIKNINQTNDQLKVEKNKQQQIIEKKNKIQLKQNNLLSSCCEFIIIPIYFPCQRNCLKNNKFYCQFIHSVCKTEAFFHINGVITCKNQCNWYFIFDAAFLCSLNQVCCKSDVCNQGFEMIQNFVQFAAFIQQSLEKSGYSQDQQLEFQKILTQFPYYNNLLKSG